MLSSLALILIFPPPASVLVAPCLAVALISAPSPMVIVSELILIFPAFPALLVSVVRLVPVCRLKVLVSILIAPASPSPVVDAVIDTPSDVVRFWASMLIMPALPVLFVVTRISPFPAMLIFSGAVIEMLPPSPVDLVEAEMKPSLLKLMSRLGLPL